ncbi:D-alanyl-D-alanine carboxypeptidase precursor [Kingella potus]|uniref:D-alanyl-D-alanine carboxypeptidase n=1 Tax=Kingella potus TaxID=265175 RepID=A0A377R2J6_9NEIS|nr:serine hydrolase domain-containing protein [Kingella potus]STR02479.1 D-alanyl-D-alanine carboxypeptidase precursor [Kingella potus]
MPVQKLEKLLAKESQKLKTLQFAMHLPRQNLAYAYSSTGSQKQHFHSASVGKLLTATLIFMAVESGKLSLDSKIASMLGAECLRGLFVADGRDYQDMVTVRQLLGHTSGINDYYDSHQPNGSAFLDDIIRHPDVFYTPKDLLDYSRRRQNAVGRPNQQFYYSDTGYILLGLLAEKIFDMPFHQILAERIFNPADMAETALAFYSEKFAAEKLAPLYINGTDIHLFTSLSCDFSGGGLSTTAEDLVRFLGTLYQGRLLNQESLAQMTVFENKYRQGLYYGLGMMQVRFREFSFFLRKLPPMQGHLGMTGVHAWYNPQTGDRFALNVGNAADMVNSFVLLSRILRLLGLRV